MQSINTYPTWQRVAAAAPAPSGIIAYLRALSLVVWFGSLVINYWWRQQWDWAEQFYEQDINLRSHYAIGFATVLIAHLTLGIPAWINAPFRALESASGRLFTLFCLLMMATAPLSASARTSGLYAVGTWAMFVLCYLYWSSDYAVVRRVLVFCGMLLFAWLFALLLHHGLSRGFGSNIGGINRNSTSALAMAAMICCALSAHRAIRWGGIGCCALFAVMVTSRGSMLAMGVFLAVYYTLHKGTLRAVWHAALAMIALAAVLLVSTFLKDIILEDVMKINDPNRGLGTGFTGRVESWREGLEVFWQRPLFGHGFRAQLSGEKGLGAHSGYVTLLIDTGVFGALLAVSAVVVEAVRRMNRARQLRHASIAASAGIDREESHRLNSVACGAMLTMLTYWIYEPFYLNLGTAIAVVFFLMFAAPDFIPKRWASHHYAV
jgi:O-antigen ligase